jgi:hypothetical protein
MLVCEHPDMTTTHAAPPAVAMYHQGKTPLRSKTALYCYCYVESIETSLFMRSGFLAKRGFSFCLVIATQWWRLVWSGAASWLAEQQNARADNDHWSSNKQKGFSWFLSVGSSHCIA